MKQVNVEETIAHVTLQGDSLNSLKDGDLLKAVEPELFPDAPGMAHVQDLVRGLTVFQQALLLSGLQHAGNILHSGKVVFGELVTDYEIQGVGLELRDDSVTYLEGGQVVEDLIGPLRVVFTTTGA